MGYNAAMEDSRHARRSLFDRIAPMYGLFYKRQQRAFDEVLDKMRAELDPAAHRSILDIGCGTGALCSVLNRRGLAVTGVDAAAAMLRVARQKRDNRGVAFIRASASERLPFEDNSFDVVIASHVLHGLRAPERRRVYTEMNRVARHLVIVHDYNKNRATLTDLVEWLEGGDYFNFIQRAQHEMEEVFCDVRAIDVALRAAWYICSPAK